MGAKSLYATHSLSDTPFFILNFEDESVGSDGGGPGVHLEWRAIAETRCHLAAGAGSAGRGQLCGARQSDPRAVGPRSRDAGKGTLRVHGARGNRGRWSAW